MGSVDYLNEYERTLLRKFSATGRSILDFDGRHLIVLLSLLLLLWLPLYTRSDAISAYQWLVSYLLVESDKKLSEEMKNQVRIFMFRAYPTFMVQCVYLQDEMKL